MSFGKRLKKARTAKKLTQVEVADKLGIDDTTISKYENDKSEPDNETLTRLLDLYGVKFDYIHGRETKDPSIEETELDEERNRLANMVANIKDPEKKKQAIAYLEYLANSPSDGAEK